VHRAHDQVQAPEQPFGQVQRAVLKDLDFGRLEQQGVSLQLVVQTLDFVELLGQTLATGTVRTWRPVGNGQVLVATV
jgi:hypothetical protein